MSNKTLVLLFLGLLGVGALVYFLDLGKTKPTFNATMPKLDTAAITKIVVNSQASGNQDITFTRKEAGGEWTLNQADGGGAPADAKTMQMMLQQLSLIKPERLAANSPDKFAQYEVEGPKATHVTVFDNAKTVFDIYLGKAEMAQPSDDPSMAQQPPRIPGEPMRKPNLKTYCRLADQNTTFVVNGMVGMFFNRKAESFLPQSQPPTAIPTAPADSVVVK